MRHSDSNWNLGRVLVHEPVIPDEPCIDCEHYEHCKTKHECCDVFNDYYQYGKFGDEPREPTKAIYRKVFNQYERLKTDRTGVWGKKRKFSDEKIREIRKLCNENKGNKNFRTKLAEKLECSTQTIGDIARRSTYREVT